MRNPLYFGLTVLALAEAHAAEFVLIDKPHAAPPAPIFVFQDAPSRTRDAAVTLADYIEKMSGQRPAVINGEPAAPPERAIWVGVQPMVKALFPKTDFEFQHPEETLIVASEKHLVIAGRDRWDPEHTQAKGRLAMKTGMQQEYGTANAVYSFLQERLGVRWLWPGEEDMRRQERIAFEPFEVRYHPQIRARSGMFLRLALGDSKEGPGELWSRFQRVQLDSLEMDGGHAFDDWWKKYHVAHPDYFALWPDGTRSPHPTPEFTKLCESNPAVWQQWLEEVDAQLQADPTRRVFNASPNDGFDYGHCVCPQCVAKDPPEAQKFTWRWKGHSEERPALSDRDVIFANTLGRLLKQRYPGRPFFVQMQAYGYSRPAPVHAIPDDNVIISSVANFHMRSPAAREEAMTQHAAWAKKTDRLLWRPNIGNQAGSAWGMPDVAMTQAGEDFRFVADHHCIGVFFDLWWLHWSTQAPHYYAVAHLAWNPYANVEEMMNDFYQRAYGPAAADLKAYWQLWERTRMEFVAEEPSRQRAFDVPKKYTPEMLAQAQSHLDAAAAKLAAADEKYRRRLAFTRCGFDFTKLVIDTRTWMQKLEASQGQDAAAKAHVAENWQRVETMKKEFPPFAINWQFVFRAPGTGSGDGNKRIMGLHPDVPLDGVILRQLRHPGLE